MRRTKRKGERDKDDDEEGMGHANSIGSHELSPAGHHHQHHHQHQHHRRTSTIRLAHHLRHRRLSFDWIVILLLLLNYLATNFSLVTAQEEEAAARGEEHNLSREHFSSPTNDISSVSLDRPGLNLTITPDDEEPVANCTDVVFSCLPVEQNKSNIAGEHIWWTFQGQNVSASVLPGGRVSVEPDESKLLIDCARFRVHSGQYACHANDHLDSNVVTLDVYVPFSIESLEPPAGISQERLDASTLLKCQVRGHPRAHITWERFDESTLKVSALEEDGRIVIENHVMPSEQQPGAGGEVTSVQSVLTFKSLKRSDNGTYICKAAGHGNHGGPATIVQRSLTTQFTVIVLEPPQIHIEKVEIENKTAALLTFAIDHRGNAPLVEFPLQLINYTAPNSSWLPLLDAQQLLNDNHTGGESVVLKVDNLIAGVSYGFRLAARNELGQSDWSYMNISVPPDVPSAITSVHLLSKTSEKFIFGVTRPSHDNGANIKLYQFLLKEKNDVQSWNETVVVDNKNGTNSKSKIMYIIPGLQPGTEYIFQVRACSSLGCGEWSSPLEVVTAEGQATPPLNVQLECTFDSRLATTNASITWQPPTSPHGIITAYNISIEGFANFRGANNRTLLDEFNSHYIHKFDPNATAPLEHRLVLRANTNYTVRVAGINNSGWGQFSPITSTAMCESAPAAPSTEAMGTPQFERVNVTAVHPNGSIYITPSVSTQSLMLSVPRASERSGRILCYRIVIVRLAKQHKDDNITAELKPAELALSTHTAVHDRKLEKESMAYIAEEFPADQLPSKVVIGDGKSSRCFVDALEYDIRMRVQSTASAPSKDNRTQRRISHEGKADAPSWSNSSQVTSWTVVNDSLLWANTFYSAFVEVTVLSANRTLLIARGALAEPMETDYKEPIISKLDLFTFGETFYQLSAVVFVCIMILILRCMMKRQRTKKMNKAARNVLELPFRRQSYFVDDYDDDVVFYQTPVQHVLDKLCNKAIPLNKLTEAYQKRHENDDALFQAEFSQLPEKFDDRTSLVSMAAENLFKNRYPDIKSYDQTRVLLSKGENDELSDYINADHVFGFDKHFICAQGPLDQTIEDFWRMIYEQECTIIVMLTGLEERGRIKCALYWSDDADRQPKNISSTFEVSTFHRSNYSDYVVRRFLLHHKPSGTTREVMHFHFTGWSDFLAPDQPSWLLRFIKRVNEHYAPEKGPIVVHCSAGVGRTGTFIAIDSLVSKVKHLRQVNTTSAIEINVLECVTELRHQRALLVQSLKQYIFVYKALVEYVEFGDTEIEGAHLAEVYQQLKEVPGNGVAIEFERLDLVPEDPNTWNAGNLEVNRSKNRYEFIIPYDTNRVVLTQLSQDQQSYINASFIESYDHWPSFIVAQDPMEATMADFWRMIIEHNVRTMVMLSELGQGQTKCPKYWPDNEFNVGDLLQVKLIQTQVDQFYHRRTFTIHNKKTNQVHQVEQYQFLGWKSGVVPESRVPFITLVDLIFKSLACEDTNNNNDDHLDSILVHCSGGGDRSSVFVAFVSLVKQLQSEKRVDIFQTARFTRAQRQGMLKSVAQYNFLYRCLIDYIDQHHLFDKSDIDL